MLGPLQPELTKTVFFMPRQLFFPLNQERRNILERRSCFPKHLLSASLFLLSREDQPENHPAHQEEQPASFVAGIFAADSIR